MIKKLILSSLLLMSSAAVAGSYHHGHRHHVHRHWNPPVHHWVVPALIGGAVVYAATRPDPVIVQQPQPSVVVSNQYMVIDGATYRKELMVINGISQEVWVRQ